MEKLMFLLFALASLSISHGSFVKISQGQTADTDYYQTIQDALNKVSADGGGTVLIDEGQYYLSKNVEMFSNTYLRGMGMNKTILKLADNASPWMTNDGKNAGFIRSLECKDLKISDITLDGNKAKQGQSIPEQYGRFGIFTESCTNVTFDKVHIMNFQGYGFDPHGTKTPVRWAKGLTITNCVSENNDWDGYTIDQTTDVLIDNCIAKFNGRHGINIVTGSQNVVIRNNYLYDNGHYFEDIGGGCGIAVQNNLNFGTRNIKVTNNTVLLSDRGSICINGAMDTLVSNNYAINATSCLQVSRGSKNITFQDNMCMTNQMLSVDLSVSSITQTGNFIGNLTTPNEPVLPDPTPISSQQPEDDGGASPAPPSGTSPPSAPPPTADTSDAHNKNIISCFLIPLWFVLAMTT